MTLTNADITALADQMAPMVARMVVQMMQGDQKALRDRLDMLFVKPVQQEQARQAAYMTKDERKAYNKAFLARKRAEQKGVRCA